MKLFTSLWLGFGFPIQSNNINHIILSFFLFHTQSFLADHHHKIVVCICNCVMSLQFSPEIYASTISLFTEILNSGSVAVLVSFAILVSSTPLASLLKPGSGCLWKMGAHCFVYLSGELINNHVTALTLSSKNKASSLSC